MASYTAEEIDAYGKHLLEKGYKPEDVAAYQEHLLKTYGPDAAQSKEDFFTDKERAASSFGDSEGVKKLAESHGYKDVRYNKAGELVGRDTLSNDWVKDSSEFTKHPINWAESKLGKALPMIGMVGGGIAGAPLAPGTSGTSVIAGAGAGAGLGEALRVGAGKYMGVYGGGPGEIAKDVAQETLGGATAEAGGQVLGKIASMIPTGHGGTLGDMLSSAPSNALAELRKLLAKGGNYVTLGQAPYEALLRLYNRPNQVIRAADDKLIRDAAHTAEGELNATVQRAGESVGRANKQMSEQMGRTKVSTQPIIDENQRLLGEVTMSQHGAGKLDANEVAARLNWERDHLNTSPRVGSKETPIMEDRPIIDSRSGVQYGTERVQTGIDKTPAFIDTNKRVPEVTMDDLRALADELKPGNALWNKTKNEVNPNQTQDAHQIVLYNKVKELLHSKYPELLAADSRYHEVMEAAKVLKRLHTEQSRMGLVRDLADPSKLDLRAQAGKVIPQTMQNEIADLEAAQALEGKELTPGRLMKGALGGGGAYLLSSPTIGLGVPWHDAVMLSAATAAATDPVLHKYLFAYPTAKVMNALEPAAVKAAPYLPRLMMQQAAKTPWDIYEERNR